jgi:hypothetical protein
MLHIASAILHEAVFGEDTTHHPLAASHTLAVDLVLDTMLEYLHPSSADLISCSHLCNTTTPDALVDLLQLTLVLAIVPATSATQRQYLLDVLKVFVTVLGEKITIRLADDVDADLLSSVLTPLLIYLARTIHQIAQWCKHNVEERFPPTIALLHQHTDVMSNWVEKSKCVIRNAVRTEPESDDAFGWRGDFSIQIRHQVV